MSQPIPSTDESGSVSLFDQIQGLDNRFWIVNVMEMFERLAYYGVRAVVAIYMVLPLEQGGPEFTHVQKGTIFAWWALMQSVLPMFTGGLADRYGHKRTIAFAIFVKIIGYLLMAAMMSYAGFFAGCLFLAAGTAIFKPGVQGTLAATLKQSNASVGWGIFYQLVNVGGFLGPVLAGVLRLLDWKYVFVSCALIVAINYLWLPFYKDPTQEEGFSGSEKDEADRWGALSTSLSNKLVDTWTGIWTVSAVAAIGAKLTGYLESNIVLGTTVLFATMFWVYRTLKPKLDEGRSDPFSVFVISSVGLFQHRVLFFCLVFSGFWLMFNQVFDLLPNVIDDWVDSSGIIAGLGAAFSTSLVPTVLAVVLGLLYGAVCGVVVLLAMRPDNRAADEVPNPAYAVVAMAISAALMVAPVSSIGGVRVALSVIGALIVTAAIRTLRIDAKSIALVVSALGGVSAVLRIRSTLLESAPELVRLAAEGQQVNPEWMINLNPGLIVFTMVGFAWLSSFVRPLTSIIIGMIVATAGSVLAGTATIGIVCILGIGVFSVGEMLSSPKKMEYLATLAKRGQEGLFMGYANIPVAIGWIVGSIYAGNRYEVAGDKANLARKHLEEAVGWTNEAAQALPRGDVVDTLATELGMTAMQVQHLLFETYQPQQIWFDIGAIGLVSIVGMVVYDRVLKTVDARAKAA